MLKRPHSAGFFNAIALIAIAGCTTVQTPVESEPIQQADQSTEADRTTAPAPAVTPMEFAELPGWAGADLGPSIEAFRRSCVRIMDRALDTPISERAPYAGTASDWRPVCEAAEVASDSESARLVFEAMLAPVEIQSGDGGSRFTGYFEPMIEARRTPEFPFTQPIPGLPDDLVQVDRSVLGGAPGRKVAAQRLSNGSLRAYPPRADIALRHDNALGYAHPADVFFLQIQGSGRLRFKDGTSLRAAYAAHNSQPFGSVANYLLDTGKITRGEASMQGIRGWMDRVPRADAQAAMNQNPRFVFFRPLPIGDPTLGPEGAALVPLTPLGSMAVDPAYHPYGVPYFVQTTSPGLGGDWSGVLVSQDTGGAIKGMVRGDIYFGTGRQAGDAAGTQNAPGWMWALLPRAVAKRVSASRDAAS
ncbi:MAG: MltA domain-containing protein [Pseudomonadota bacterium]